MELNEINESEEIRLDSKRLRHFQKEILSTERSNRVEELEDIISEYISKHKELTLKEVDILRDVVDFSKDI